MTRRDNLRNLRNYHGRTVVRALLFLIRLLAGVGQPLVDGLRWLGDRLEPVDDPDWDVTGWGTPTGLDSLPGVPAPTLARTPGDVGPAAIQRVSSGPGPNTGLFRARDKITVDGRLFPSQTTPHPLDTTVVWPHHGIHGPRCTVSEPCGECRPAALANTGVVIDLHAGNRQADASEIAAAQYAQRRNS